MNDYLDFKIDLQFECVRNERKAFHTMFALFVLNMSFSIVDIYLVFYKGNNFSMFGTFGAGMFAINAIWSLAFCSDYYLDYRRSKLLLNELMKKRSTDLIELEKNVIKMKR